MSSEVVHERVFLCLGSNLGDRARFLAEARAALAADPRIRILRRSSVLENPPLLYAEQGPFLNQVLEVGTGYEPLELLAVLKQLEGRLGRVARFRNGPREIDLDILSFDATVLQSPDLTLPHPGLRDRPFLWQLLQELDETPEALGMKRA